MKLTQVAGKNLQYDGLENNFYKTYSITLKNEDLFTFSPMDVVELEHFEKKDVRDLTSVLLDNLRTIKKFKPEADFIYYKNQEGLTPYVKETEKYIAVVSLGEFQPNRYKVIVEAIFLKE
jgi:hypothetical protein